MTNLVLTAFVTAKLFAMANAMNMVFPDDMEPCAQNDSVWTWNGLPLRICTDLQGNVNHIGYRLFNQEYINQYDTPTVLYFLERYFLERDLSVDSVSVAERLDIDQVTITKGSLSDVKSIDMTSSFTIESVPRRIFKANWRTSVGDLSVVFPADCQLIYGANAVELENILIKKMKVEPEPTDSFLISPWVKGNQKNVYSFKACDYGTFLSPEISSTIFIYDNPNDNWQLYCNMKKRTWSVSNIMLTGCNKMEIPINIIVDKYGGKTDSLCISLKSFTGFCKHEGCKSFSGIKTVNDEEITGTLFLYNEHLGYCHVLSYIFPLEILKGVLSEIRARLYAYVPLQNVTDDFFNYKY